MPFKTEKCKVTEHESELADKRKKLTSKQKEEILALHSQDGISQRELARRFNVSRRLISFIVDPKKREENYQKRLERGGSKAYYDREAHNKAMRNHRRHKHELFKDSV